VTAVLNGAAGLRVCVYHVYGDPDYMSVDSPKGSPNWILTIGGVGTHVIDTCIPVTEAIVAIVVNQKTGASWAVRGGQAVYTGGRQPLPRVWPGYWPAADDEPPPTPRIPHLQEPRCDCGADKCNTTHSTWCSLMLRGGP
jgi:hypothetical protein